MKLSRLTGLVGVLAMAVPATAYANGFEHYRVCGGSAFQTCAAVNITVVGSTVNVSVWNLSGSLAGTANTNTTSGVIFTGIGFYNLPAGIDAVGGSLTMNGPARSGNNPQPWKISNNSRVNFIVDVAGKGGQQGQNGIASGCASAAQLPGAPPHLWQNPCASTWNLSNSGYVNFSFQITGGSWDPNTSNIVIRGVDGISGVATECWVGDSPAGVPGNCTTVTPEPVSMTLLATGLAGMGGIGFFRRRKKTSPTA